MGFFPNQAKKMGTSQGIPPQNILLLLVGGFLSTTRICRLCFSDYKIGNAMRAMKPIKNIYIYYFMKTNAERLYIKHGPISRMIDTIKCIFSQIYVTELRI